MFGGTYLLFSYYREKLLTINALVFFVIGIRACTEYYIQQVDSFELATNIASFHGTVSVLAFIGLRYCIWFYIRPFRNWKLEKIINAIFLWVFLVIPALIVMAFLLQRQIFYFHPERINGYWQFARYQIFVDFPIDIYWMRVTNIMILGVLFSSIWKVPTHRLRKSLLLFTFIVSPYIYTNYFESYSEQWNIPNIASLLLIHALIVSWFVSGYRLFQAGLDTLKKDLLNSISDLAVTTDLNFHINYMNEQAKSFFSSTTERFDKFLAVNSYQSLQQVKNKMQILMEQRNAVEVSLLNEQSVPHIFSIKIAPYHVHNQHIGYTFLLTDLTDIRHKEKELEHLNATKDRLFAIIGHDLRKPALAFRGISEKVSYLIEEKRFKTLDKLGKNLEKAAFSLNNLLDNLLNWALKQRNVLPYDPQPVNVVEATEEILDIFEKIAADKSIVLQTNLHHQHLVFADYNAFSTIVRNLLDNAIKYTPHGGQVSILSEKNADGILLKIADTGIGMKVKQLDHIFELQKNKSTRGTAGETGSGLGLSLIKDLVTLNKGKIAVRSQVNEGTIFEVLLPAVTLSTLSSP